VGIADGDTVTVLVDGHKQVNVWIARRRLSRAWTALWQPCKAIHQRNVFWQHRHRSSVGYR
jgi:hypothetical protein